MLIKYLVNTEVSRKIYSRRWFHKLWKILYLYMCLYMYMCFTVITMKISQVTHIYLIDFCVWLSFQAVHISFQNGCQYFRHSHKISVQESTQEFILFFEYFCMHTTFSLFIIIILKIGLAHREKLICQNLTCWQCQTCYMLPYLLLINAHFSVLVFNCH